MALSVPSFARYLAPALVPVLAAAPVAAEEYLTVEQALKLAFPGADSIPRRNELVDADARAALEGELRALRVPRAFSWYEGRKDGKSLGYAVIGNVRGKSMPITIMTVFAPDLAVRAVELLVYRESHGHEIRQQRFRDQFRGATLETPLQLKRDVRNLAGATISCRAVTDGVHDLLRVMHEVVGVRSAEEVAVASEPVAASVPGAAVPLTRKQVCMGTTLEVRLWAGSRAAAEEATSLAFAEMARLEARWSAFRPESEISQLGARAGGAPLAVAPETLDVLAKSKDWAQRTGGALDVTAAPLQALWRASLEAGVEPSAEELRATSERCGWRGIELDPAAGTARLSRAGARLDLGAIGKGYALDRVAAILERRGIRSGLLDFGGQILVLGPPPGADAFEIPLRDPRDPERVLTVLRVSRGSVATTADYERGLARGERRLSYVVDPRTGRPAAGLLGAVVVGDRALDTDALSTALFVLGRDEGLALAERLSARAWLFAADGDVRSSALLAAHPLERERTAEAR
jgi:thiamine biosynthesis lipoprotein